MTNKDLFDAFKNIDENFIAEAAPAENSPEKLSKEEIKSEEKIRPIKRRKNIIAKSAVAACICLIAAAGIFALANRGFIKNSDTDSGSSGGDASYDSAAEEIDGDYTAVGSDNTTDGFSSSSATSEEDYIASVIPWDELSLTGKYPEAEIGEVIFSAEGETLESGKIGAGISDITLTGYDEINNQRHTAKGKAFEIKGISPDCAAAVKIDGSEEYYVYTCHLYQPGTLGQFIDDLNLENTLSVGNVYEDRFNQSGEYITAEYTGLSKDAVFEILLSDRAAPAEKDFDSRFFGNELIGISIDLKLLGYENISLAVTDEGYVTTNILATGKAFYIGKEKAEEFYKYVTENCRRVKYEVRKPEDNADTPDKSSDSAASHSVSHYTP